MLLGGVQKGAGGDPPPPPPGRLSAGTPKRLSELLPEWKDAPTSHAVYIDPGHRLALRAVQDIQSLRQSLGSWITREFMGQLALYHGACVGPPPPSSVTA